MKKIASTSYKSHYKNFKNQHENTTIWTSNYFSVWGKNNIVRISNGMPKGIVACDEIKELYPKWVWVKYHLPWQKFIPLYMEQLSKLDVHKLAQRCKGKILCCYERDLMKAHCHRELVKKWFLENGYECKEVEI